MKQRFWLFKRGNVYYVQDSETGKQQSLDVTDKLQAQRLRAAKEEAIGQKTLNLAVGRAYLAASDPSLVTRTWNMVMEKLCARAKKDTSRERNVREMSSRPFDLIRRKKLIETTAEDFLRVLEAGKISTNLYLRCLHNLALGLGWLPWPVLAREYWPKVKNKEKRAVTLEEHQKIIGAEKNRERRLYYELLWETGASQSDAVKLHVGNVDWESNALYYQRQKTGEWAYLMIGEHLAEVLKQLSDQGPLFPHISKTSDNARSSEFRRRCNTVRVYGISLHSYRYAWAERAKTCGYPERFAQEALGHNSKAVHRAYAKKAKVKLPSLEEYEKLRAGGKVIPLPIPNGTPAVATAPANQDSGTHSLPNIAQAANA
jgi:integrase